MKTKKQICQRFTVTCRGNDESDIELAFDEAVNKIKEGYYSGHNSNDTGAYYFKVSDVEKKGEWPA